MMKNTEKPWIIIGHKTFAEKGPSAITVEGLARAVNKNKSSFYHHFVDLEIFTGRLLNYHFERSIMIIEKESRCEKIVPDLLTILVKHTYDILFHRQLLVNRSNIEFDDLYTKITNKGINSILRIWNKELGLPGHSSKGKRLLKMGIDDLFQRSTLRNLTVGHLESSFEELKLMARELRNHPRVDGPV